MLFQYGGNLVGFKTTLFGKGGAYVQEQWHSFSLHLLQGIIAVEWVHPIAKDLSEAGVFPEECASD